MLIAAHSPPIALHAQKQTVSSPRRQVDAYHASVPTTPLPMSVPVAVPVPVSVPVQVQDLPQAPPNPQQPVEEPPAVPVLKGVLAAQLAYLASQHHASEYNRFKFGQKGSPVMYVPLSLQAPQHVRELRARQTQNSEQRMWWISERNGCDPPEQTVRQEAQTLANTEGQTLPSMSTGPSSNIQQEISAAMSSQIPSAHITKTSHSHPINISMVIPFEVLPSIAVRLVPPSTSSPVLFHLPEHFHLDRVIAMPAPSTQIFVPFRCSGCPSFHTTTRPPVPVTWAQDGNSELLQNALNGEFTFPPPWPLFVPSQEQRRMLQSMTLPPPPLAVPVPGQVPTPPSPPKGVIRRRPRYGRATSAPPAFRTKGMQRRASNVREVRQGLPRYRSSPEVSTMRLIDVPSVVPSTILALDQDRVNPDAQEDELSNNANGRGLMLPPVSVTPSPPLLIKSSLASPEDPIIVRQLGNMYLSSCPGKKVRLSGPVNGRAAICRDLRADLSRVKDLGVECIICCLDDNELGFLGVFWAEYSSVADELGLDVLRILMPEGLSPLSPASLDMQLDRIIETYSMRGVPVLAHCRGGVGRAGLVASCWMLKLGLCGWKDPEVCARSCSEHTHPGEPVGSAFERPSFRGREQRPLEALAMQVTQPPIPNHTPSPIITPANIPRVCCATVHLVERVLTVMRKRRSLKAVETFEQVRFLVDFIDYLDAKAHLDGQAHI